MVGFSFARTQSHLYLKEEGIFITCWYLPYLLVRYFFNFSYLPAHLSQKSWLLKNFTYLCNFCYINMPLNQLSLACVTEIIYLNSTRMHLS